MGETPSPPVRGPEGVTIRPAREHDLAQVGRIYNHAVLHSTATFDLEPWTDEKLRNWLDARDEMYPAFVAERDGRVVGWAALSPFHERPAWLPTVQSAVYVEPESRGRGVGEALLLRILDEAARAGHHVVVALVVEGNDASLALHRKLGFEEVGAIREAGLKFGRRLDVTLLQQHLRADAE